MIQIGNQVLTKKFGEKKKEHELLGCLKRFKIYSNIGFQRLHGLARSIERKTAC